MTVKPNVQTALGHSATWSLFCIGLLCLLNCRTTSLDPGLRVIPPPLPDGEMNSYRVLAQGDSVGTYTSLLRHVHFKGIPAYEVVIVTRAKTGRFETTDSAIVFITRDTMLPLSSFRFITTGPALVTTAANYGEKTVAVSTYSSGEEKQRLLPNAKRTYDIDQLTTLGRALRIDAGKKVPVNVVDPMGPPLGGVVRPALLSSGASETVTVPAGSFDCNRFALELEEDQVELWYEKAGACRMVRYQARATGVSIELMPSARIPPAPGVPSGS